MEVFKNQNSCCTVVPNNFTAGNLIAVYIDSLVMISIEKSETNKKRGLEIQDKFVLDHGQCSGNLRQICFRP